MRATMPHNLPAELTSFVGRVREAGEVKRLLGSTRLLTLTGPGGVGKTRLALRAASQVDADYPDGVWLVELASLKDGGLVPRAVAAPFGLIEDRPGTLLRNLTEHLKPRQLLLVLDNCEHVLNACAQLSLQLLAACPSLRILTTSREPLNVPGEVAWLVPSLGVPAETDGAKGEWLGRYPALRLFADRASAARPGFALTHQNASCITHICRRLDGIPLAIELAAVRTRALGIEQIASRLDDAFSLLSGGGRSSVPRHVTLRSLIDWSHELLMEQERVLFRRPAVFAGGWTLEAAEAVCSDAPLGGAVLDMLTQLVEKSLVTFARSDQPPEDPGSSRRWAAARSGALLAAGRLAMRQGGGEARELMDQSLALARKLGEPRLLAACLSFRGRLAYWRNELSQAQPLMAEALALAREADVPQTILQLCTALA